MWTGSVVELYCSVHYSLLTVAFKIRNYKYIYQRKYNKKNFITENENNGLGTEIKSQAIKSINLMILY